MKYRVHYAMADGRSLQCDGGEFSFRPLSQEVSRVLRSSVNGIITYHDILLVEPL